MDDALKLQLSNLQLSKVTSKDKVIGRGAYGRAIEVYVHGTLCAAKEIHPALVENVSAKESETIRRSFCEECVKTSRIHHPNVVQMLGIYYPTPQAKLPWLVMELMQTSLKGFLEKYEQGKVPLHFKLSMLVDVAEGLEFLHGQNIIHRDLSSNNVLLTKNLIAKIADLGVAKVVQENKMKTHTQAPGTTHFMPPEALKSKPHYGKPVDVFSLACVALHVMSHQWPEPKDLLPEDSMTALTELQRRDEYITFCTQPALKELVESCLHNKPEQRPEISTICEKLTELKVTIEKQIPFATDNNFEMFDVVRQVNIQNQKLTAANKKLTINVAQLEEKDQQIQKMDDQLREKDQQIQNRDDRLHREDQQIREKDEQLRKMDDQLREKDQQIQKRDDQLHKKDHLLKKDSEMNKEMQEILNQLQEKLQEKNRKRDNHLEEKSQQIQDRDDQLRHKDQEIQEKDQQIQKIDAQLQEKDRQIQERDNQLCNKDQEIQKKEQEIQKRDERLREKDQQIRERDDQLREKDQQVNPKIMQLVNICSSTSKHHKEMGIHTLPPVCYDDPISTNFDSVQHIDPSSERDDVGTELIKGSTELGYRNPPLRKGPPIYRISSITKRVYAKQHSLPDSSVGGTKVYSNLKMRLAKKQETTKRSSSKPADKRDLSSLKSILEKKKEARAKVEGMNEGDHENFLPLYQPSVPKPTPRLKDPVPGESSVEFHKGHFAEPFSSERNYKMWLCVDCHCTNQVSSTRCSRCSKPQKNSVQGCIRLICNQCGLMLFYREAEFDTVCPNCHEPLVTKV